MIDENRLAKFKKLMKFYTEWNGINALEWVRYIDNHFTNESLNKRLTRNDLLSKEFAKELSDIEHSYAILSWGGMRRDHAKKLYAKNEWLHLVEEIRKGNVHSREDAYEKFYQLKNDNQLPGMGPAYYTKLICFLNPELKGYIMDQWTAKSINILCNSEIVKLNSSGYVDSSSNTREKYAKFCEVIDEIADGFEMRGIDVEEAMFSNGGRNKGKWRKFVIDTWTSEQIKQLSDKLVDEVEMITFTEVLSLLEGNSLETDTLAYRSRFRVESVSDMIVLTTSSGNKHYISQNLWDLVLQRIEDLPYEERLMASRYVDGTSQFNWTDCPNRIVSPYIPAIIRHFNS